MRGEFVDLHGARIYYYAAGTRGVGEPIVFVHGFPTSGHLWSEVVPLVPAGHRVVVVDMLGYGRSDRPGPGAQQELSIRAHADRLLALLDVLGINYACVVGHDLGGGVAQSLAVRHPQRVSRLCLVSSVAFDAWPPREVQLARAMLPLTRHLPPTWLLSLLRTDLLRGYTEHERGARSIELFVKPFATDEGRDAFMQHLLAIDSAQTQELAPRLADLVQPTAILWGQHDPFLPASLAQRLHDAIPGSTLDIIPHARHFVPEEAPHRLAEAIGALFRR